MPGLPPQVICYERADDIGFGVSGVVTRARGIRQSFPDLDLSQIPLAVPVAHEAVAYLLDPVGASRRSPLLRAADRCIRAFRGLLPYEHEALRLPYVPPFLRKDGALLLSIGQFNQWVGSQVMGTGAVQIWPGMPVAKPLWENGRVGGVRLTDQGTDLQGRPDAGFLPGMDIRAALTVIGDGPVGPIGRQLDEQLGLPEGHHRREWAVGAKVVVDLPEGSILEPGTVFHTFGYPEPEIFGFMYVHPDRVASLTFASPVFDLPAQETYQTQPNTVAALCALLVESGVREIVLIENLYWDKPFAQVLTGAGWDVKAIESAGNHKVRWEDTRNRGAFPGYSRFKVPWGGYVYPAFELNQRFEKTDVLISLAKLKQHATAGITGAVKNCFGNTPTAIYGDNAPDEKGLNHRAGLFHGGTTIANPIDSVLGSLGVTIDGTNNR